MKKLSEKGRKALRAIYRVLGVTAVSLIFQACYGMPPDMGDDVVIHGSVKSKTDVPIPGIKVSVEDTTFYDLTDNDGYFNIYMPRQDYYTVNFEDIDGPENGVFKPRSMTVTTYQGESSLSVELEEVE